jgi:hypothetical protein
MQNDDEGHDTAGRREAPDSRLAGELQVVPSNITTFSRPSIATQKDGEAHETESSEPPAIWPFAVSTGAGELHALPL